MSWLWNTRIHLNIKLYDDVVITIIIPTCNMYTTILHNVTYKHVYYQRAAFEKM